MGRRGNIPEFSRTEGKKEKFSVIGRRSIPIEVRLRHSARRFAVSIDAVKIPRRRRGALGKIPEVEVSQDLFDDAGVVYQSNDAKHSAPLGASQKISKIHFANEARLGASGDWRQQRRPHDRNGGCHEKRVHEPDKMRDFPVRRCGCRDAESGRGCQRWIDGYGRRRAGFLLHGRGSAACAVVCQRRE